MSEIIHAIRGMNDILPDEAKLWTLVETETARLLGEYGYAMIRIPVVETTQLFSRSIGEVTDIVEKEMYTFADRNGDSLTLRPEATAGIVRAVLEHNLLYDGSEKLWTLGPMFRYERPQKGRYRQFHQIDAEALGYGGPDVDAEQIVMLARLWKRLGISDVELHLNSIGDADARAAHRAELVGYFGRHSDVLDDDARRRLHTNPLRILDSKNPAMQTLVEGAPRLIDFLGAEAREHFDGVTALLAAAGVAYVVNPRLVRGLDYYNRTVFEWVTTRLGAQGTIAGGGRYDALLQQLGGKPAPACGFAIGVERIVLLLGEHGVAAAPAPPDAYIVHAGQGAGAFALRVAEQLRDAGLAVLLHCGGGSFKAQMKRADASLARFAIIVGEDEIGADEVSIKPLRESGEQRRVPRSDAARALRA